MSFERYIAQRYFSSGRFFVSISTWISIIGVTLGVAVVCIVTSAHNGFESEIRNRLLGTTSHISIFALNNDFITDYREVMDEVDQVPGVVASSPFIYYKSVIRSEKSEDGIIVRGIQPDLERKTAIIADVIKAGSYAFTPVVEGNDTIPGILLGNELARRLDVYLGEMVAMYSLRGEDIRSRATPRVKKFYVSGIFETGMYEFDGQMAYISLKSAQDLFRTGDAVNTIHLKLTDIYQADRIAPKIDSLLDYRFQVVPWNILNKNLFGWIELEKIFLFAGFILIVIVASFSIISALVMLTMEKRAEIGILKTMGTTPGSIARIFVYKGLWIGIIGVLVGWVIGFLIAYLQNTFKFFQLPPDIYFVSYIPIDIHPLDFVLAGAITIVVCFLAALYPALQAARASVIDVLRE
ncbi:MAG: ABC transporter permease [Candidatus Zixiibacteriota bacterium]|jgi:lipoprotein-releasing system permease protein